jgi:hypothetical protein
VHKLPDDYEKRLRAKLAPERMRATLSVAGVILIVHEEAKHAVIDRVRDFHWGDKETYARDVTSLDRNPFRASAKWLVNNEVITDAQMEVLEKFGAHRHKIAHGSMNYVLDPNAEPDLLLLAQALQVLGDIHRFWIQVELDTFADHYKNATIDDTESPLMSFLTMITQVATDSLLEAYERTKAQPAQGD